MTDCPHSQIEYCPLYCAGHSPTLWRFGCVDDLAKPCLVKRGKLQYQWAVNQLSIADMAFVALIEWRELESQSLKFRKDSLQ